MASSVSRAPLISLTRTRTVIFSSQSTIAPLQCRQFSLSSQSNGRMALPQTAQVRQPAQPSMKSRGQQMARSELPQDVGLLPGTFIRPLWRDLPSIFQYPRERLHFEWLWAKSWFQNFLGLVVYSKTEGKGLPLRLKERRQVAREFHKRMYSAFADGDVATLRKICCTGLANNLTGRITARPKGEKVTWSLDKYIRSPSTFFTGLRVVSDRAVQIPELRDSGVRQVILRITSRQSTGKVRQPSRGKSPTEKPVKQQNCTEYIVIQKLRWLGEEEPWRVWGHATPTTMDDLSSPHFAMGLSAFERLEAMKHDMAGGKR
ncbi:uncharacterized protein BDV17DRAFT_202657 [Aspergillus undulatus]|uniref:uncharacterized protein n=1 Tax=Aspergillus undulatus TaxID=1810928 RepID=UPI003CCD240D